MLNNLNPIIAQALAPFVQPVQPPVQIDQQWLDLCRSQLRNAKWRAEVTPEWNPDKKTWQQEVVSLERDIEELLSGINRDNLTSTKSWRMPEWGTYGT